MGEEKPGKEYGNSFSIFPSGGRRFSRSNIGIRGKFRSSEILKLARKTTHQTVMQKITYHNSPILSSAVQGCSKPLVGFHFCFDYDSSSRQR